MEKHKLVKKIERIFGLTTPVQHPPEQCLQSDKAIIDHLIKMEKIIAENTKEIKRLRSKL